ncbi:MAG: glycosyltransferase family 2 protein [Lachnospiraceae bacterium]|jgi:glycosyltransferase involved in cell wall biosynthesis|nr:glycosyltransferase family 2 protein [Lachnospiraceae bacterium]
MKPVSVIIPTYNRREKLQLSVESVLGQSYSDIELIIIDDGSTDQTDEYVSSLADKRVVYHKFSKNQGVCAARNKGVELASHEIIAFQDSDDIWKVDKLKKQMDYWENNKDYLMVYSAYQKADKMRVPDSHDREQLESNVYLHLLWRIGI